MTKFLLHFFNVVIRRNSIVFKISHAHTENHGFCSFDLLSKQNAIMRLTIKYWNFHENFCSLFPLEDSARAFYSTITRKIMSLMCL